MSHLIEQAKFSCALGGLQTVLAISKGIPIVHAGPGCASRQFSYLGNGEYMVEFDEPQRAVTSGQAVVIYDGDIVVGGGTIK